MEKQIHKLFVANFLGNLYFYLPVATLFFLANGINLQTIMLGNMMYSIVAFLAEVPTGVLADRLGHHKSVGVGYGVDGVSLLMMALFPTPVVFVMACAIRGFSGAFLSGSREALLYEYGKDAGRSYKRDYSHLVSYEVLGFAAGAMLAGVIVQVWGGASYLPAFVLTFATVLAASLLAASLKPHKIEREVGQSRLHELRESFKLFKSSQMLKYLFIVVGLTYGGKYILVDLYPPHLEANNAPPFFLGSALSIGSLAQYFVIRHSYKVEKWLGARGALVALAVGTGLGYVVFGLATNPYVLVISFILLFGMLESTSVFVSDYANQHARSGIRATVLSGIGFSREVFKAGYKAVLGVALGVFALSQVLAFYGVFLVLGAVVSYWLLKRTDREVID